MPVTFDTRSPLCQAAPAISPPEQATAFLERTAGVFVAESGSESKRWTSRACGRLDLMGGIAEYTGAVVLGVPTSAGVSVAVQPRDDRSIVVYDLSGGREHGTGPVSFDMHLLESGDSVADGAAVAAALGSGVSDYAGSVVGAVYAMRASGKIDATHLGATVVVDADLPMLVDLAPCTAAIVATIEALCRAWDLALDSLECAALATRAKNEALAVPSGMSAAVCALHGKPNLVNQYNCCTNEVLTPLPIPRGVAIVGIDCGPKHDDAVGKYVLARVASFMGRRFIKEIIESRNGRASSWNGWLSQLTVDEFITQFRDRLPTRIRGSDFLMRYGDIADPLTTVDPDTMYKIRSRSEHHIYEADRTRKFADCLIRASRADDGTALAAAGELMLASHWSYGQRCGLGSVPTDRLVSTLRRRGVDAGVYGAKVSGHGAGGVVVALITDNDMGRSTLRDVLDDFESATGLTTQLFVGSSPGALEFGVHGP